MSRRLPLEEREARGRAPGRDSGGRPLPPEGELVHLSGADEVPEPPERLEQRGRDLWAVVWTAARWLSPQTDRKLMERRCQAEDERYALREMLDSVGHWLEGSQGQPVLNPLLDKIRTLDDQILRMETALGLTPQARGALGVGKVVPSKAPDGSQPAGLAAVLAASAKAAEARAARQLTS